MKANDYNLIAPFYDFIGRIVYGDKLLKSTTYFTSSVMEHERVLILGGGTGQLLRSLEHCQHIDYVEMSHAMIERAKKRTESSISFIQEDFFEFESDTQYDVIICPYFLDLFETSSLRYCLDKIKMLLKENGRLLVADFNSEKGYCWLSWLMYRFFRLTTNIGTHRLLPIKSVILNSGLIQNEEVTWMDGFIFSTIFSRSGKPSE